MMRPGLHRNQPSIRRTFSPISWSTHSNTTQDPGAATDSPMASLSASASPASSVSPQTPPDADGLGFVKVISADLNPVAYPQRGRSPHRRGLYASDERVTDINNRVASFNDRVASVDSRVKEWVPPALLEFVLRERPLSAEEVSLMGLKDALLVASAREANRSSTIPRVLHTTKMVDSKVTEFATQGEQGNTTPIDNCDDTPQPHARAASFVYRSSSPDRSPLPSYANNHNQPSIRRTSSRIGWSISSSTTQDPGAATDSPTASLSDSASPASSVSPPTPPDAHCPGFIKVISVDSSPAAYPQRGRSSHFPWARYDAHDNGAHLGEQGNATLSINRDHERDLRDKEGQGRLGLRRSDKYDRDRLSSPAGSTSPGTKERDPAPYRIGIKGPLAEAWDSEQYPYSPYEWALPPSPANAWGTEQDSYAQQEWGPPTSPANAWDTDDSYKQQEWGSPTSPPTAWDTEQDSYTQQGWGPPTSTTNTWGWEESSDEHQGWGSPNFPANASQPPAPAFTSWGRNPHTMPRPSPAAQPPMTQSRFRQDSGAAGAPSWRNWGAEAVAIRNLYSPPPPPPPPPLGGGNGQQIKGAWRRVHSRVREREKERSSRVQPHASSPHYANNDNQYIRRTVSPISQPSPPSTTQDPGAAYLQRGRSGSNHSDNGDHSSSLSRQGNATPSVDRDEFTSVECRRGTSIPDDPPDDPNPLGFVPGDATSEPSPGDYTSSDDPSPTSSEHYRSPPPHEERLSEPFASTGPGTTSNNPSTTTDSSSGLDFPTYTDHESPAFPHPQSPSQHTGVCGASLHQSRSFTDLPTTGRLSDSSEPEYPDSHARPNETEPIIKPKPKPSCVDVPTTPMNPTLSSWLKNMDKLSRLIDRLQELASAAPENLRRRLYSQVDSLRTASKRQQQRYLEFLRLTEEYADRYLLDISTEIELQSSFLEKLEKRLDMAKTLYRQADDLRKSYESGTMDVMKSVRETALKQLLPAESDLFREVEFVLREIRRCYKELDKFWKEEICRADTAFRTRRVDPSDTERWRNFKASLEQTIKSWKANKECGDIWNMLHDKQPGSSLQGGDLGAIASSLLPAMNTLKGSLRRIHESASVESSNMSLVPILRAELGLAENNKQCFTFFRRCVEFGEMVADSSAALINHLAFSRIRAPNGLLERAMALMVEARDVLVENEAPSQGSRTFDSTYKQAVSLQQKTTIRLDDLVKIVSNWIVVADGLPDSLPDGFSLGRLRKLADTWEKERASMRMVLATLTDDPAERLRYRCLSSTGSRPCIMARLMTGLVGFVRS